MSILLIILQGPVEALKVLDLIPSLRMFYIPQFPFLPLSLLCIWGLWLFHVCGVPIHMY